MNRRLFTLQAIAAFGIIVMPKKARADQDTLAALSDYLRGLKSMKAKFTQKNQSGGVKKGNFYLKRPGKARFDYGNSDKSKVIVKASAMHVFDGKSNTKPSVYPTTRSPLQHLLKKNVDLRNSDTVLAVTRKNNKITLKMRHKKRPETGTLYLTFATSPLQLTGWTAVTQSGEKVRVSLSSINQNVKLPSKLFRV